MSVVGRNSIAVITTTAAKASMACICTDGTDELQPICKYLKRHGWGENNVQLLSDYNKFSNQESNKDFTLSENDNDPYKVVLRPFSHPTKLFKTLQSRDWGAALDCLHKNPTEAKIWIYRETDFPECQLLWQLLPLHAAIALGAPAYLILELLQAYPGGAKKWDSKRSLPIHLAASRVDKDDESERILYHLLKAFPESAGIENGKGRTPIELAYVAQMRKEKKDNRHSLSGADDEREPDEEGFELELEIREEDDENPKSDDNERSNWSLIETSFSPNGSHSTSCSFEHDSNSPETSIPLSSSKTECATSCSSSSIKAVSGNTTSSTHRSADKSASESFSQESTLSLEKETISTSLNKPDSSPASSAPVQSFERPPRPSISSTPKYSAPPKPSISASSRKPFPGTKPSISPTHKPPSSSSPKKSLPSPLAMLKSRSWSIESKSSKKDCSSIRTNIDVSKTGYLDAPMPACTEMNHTRSFDVTPTPAMHSSPVKSLPSPIKAFKHRSKSRVHVKTNPSSESLPLLPISTMSSDTDLSCKQAYSLDNSPPRSFKTLKSRLPSSKSKSQTIALLGGSFDAQSIGDTNTETNFDKAMKSPTKSREQEHDTTLDDIISSAILSLDQIDTALANKNTRAETSTSVRSCTSPCSISTSVKSSTSSCSIKTEAATPRIDMSSHEAAFDYHGGSSDGTEPSVLQLLAVVGVSEDSSDHTTIKTQISSFEQDQILKDFVDEAIENTVNSSNFNSKDIIRELHKKKINTIEDLLALNQNDFLSLFSDKNFGHELRRLLEVEGYENSLLDSIYEEAFSGSSAEI